MTIKTVVAALVVACALVIGMVPAALGADAGSLQFNKKGHVVLGDIFKAPEGTIEFWLKPASIENNEWVMGRASDKDNAMEFGFGMTSLMHMVKRNGEWTYAAMEKKELPVNEWIHVACTFNKDKATLFVNGAPKGSRTDNFALDHLTGGDLTLGCGSNKREMYNGSIAEVRLSSVIRYTAAFTPSKTPFEPDAQTVALYHGGGEGDVVTDAGSQKHDGKITGVVTRSAESPFAAPAAK